MMQLKRAADRLIGQLVPKASAGACVPPDCYTDRYGRRCCYSCYGTLVCR